MNSQMSRRQRVLAAMQRQEVDRLPCSPAFNPLYPVQRTSWNFPWPQSASIEERTAYQVEQLGVDMVLTMGIDLARPGPEVTSRTWVDGATLHKVYSTPDGDLHASVRYDDRWPHGEEIPLFCDFNVGHFEKPWLADESDLRCLRHVLRVDTTGESRRKGSEFAGRLRLLADRYDLAIVANIGQGLTGAQKLCGAEALCLLTLDNPQLVHDYLALEHELNLAAIQAAAEWGVDVVRRNGFYETADFYSPAMLEQFITGHVRRENELARQAGLLSSYTIHTGIMPLLEHLAGLGFDNLFGIDVAFKDTSMTAIRQKLMPHVSLWTGPSSTYHLWHGPEVVRQAVRDIVEAFGRRGLVLAPAVSAHSIMPWESTLAMIDEWKKLR